MSITATDKRRFTIIAVLSFILCFMGVVSDNDVLVVDMLCLVTGVAIGLSIARTYRRVRDRRET